MHDKQPDEQGVELLSYPLAPPTTQFQQDEGAATGTGPRTLHAFGPSRIFEESDDAPELLAEPSSNL